MDDTALTPKSKMVSFRLTSEEYKTFREVCHGRGMRNISELVRAAVNQMITEKDLAVNVSLESRVDSLESRVNALMMTLEGLTKIVEAQSNVPATVRDFLHAVSVNR